ncbi:RICIN domain-containing protein [Streptomyces sp. 184]|uniref:RICIN domain-containing protein n=1 Tax=Streptomyces sp. 184 TaxID=1827526 RepID=UPI003891B4D5
MRRTLSGTAAVLCAVLLSLLPGVGTAHAAPVTIGNATQFTDPAGAPVHAHGGGVVKVGAYYYWFGENGNADNTFRYVSAYRSTDLKTWEFRNHVLTGESDPELDWANVERPKVVYNKATGQFVMWMHKESGSGGMAGPWETLTARHSGKCADVANFDMSEDVQLVQWGCGSGVNQHFWFTDAGSGYVQIMARHSGKCLAVAGASTADGALAVQKTCNGSSSQQWKAEATDVSGHVRLVARHSGKCLDVINQSTADGTALAQWTCNAGDNQKWARSRA